MQGVATIFWTPPEDGIDELITPAIDCSSYDEVWIAFDHSYYHYSGAYTAQVLGSDNNGGTWPHMVWDYEQSYGRPGGVRDSFDVSGWAASQGNVRFNWRGDGDSYNLNCWSVDNVAIYGFTGSAAEPFDLSITQILEPCIHEPADQAIQPRIVIYNNADTASTITILCRIRDLQAAQNVYEHTYEYVVADPGVTEVDTFTTFMPELNRSYEIFFLMTHGDDTDAENNEFTWRFSSYEDVVTPTTVIIPTDNQEGVFQPQATFAEQLGAEYVSAMLHCKITNIATSNVVYLKSVTNHLFDDANQSLDATFPEAVLPLVGDYEITFWATDREGADISQPDLVDTFTYTGGGAGEVSIIDELQLSVSDGRISFYLPESERLTLRVYDAAGKVVQTAADGNYSTGEHYIDWNRQGLSDGVYFIRMETNTCTKTHKQVLLR